MDKHNLNDFVRGWFVGGFKPSLYNTKDVEVAIQHFSKGDKESAHFHKIATEITVVVSGKARMNKHILKSGDILSISPGEVTDFEALEDTITAVVKLPGALNDKYLEKEEC